MKTTGPAAQVIAGRYEVTKTLGSGTYGDVYEVFDHHLQQTCALKLLKQQPFGVWAEAEILNRLHGEHILPIRNADLAQGVPYLVTDLATHGTVADQIPPDVGLPVATAVRWARQACQGLARIHDHKLLHCDLKPENLFLTDRRDVVVGDLGQSKLQDHNWLARAAGSLLTLAPEVARVGVPGQQLTNVQTCSVRSDVYSLGATLFWMLAGSQPLPGVKSHSVVWSASQPDLWDAAPHVTQGLRDIVNTAIPVKHCSCPGCGTVRVHCRCHSVWHLPRSNWMKRESTGANFTLRLAESGIASAGCARFKSPLAQEEFLGPDLETTWSSGRSGSQWWHQGGTDSVEGSLPVGGQRN